MECHSSSSHVGKLHLAVVVFVFFAMYIYIHIHVCVCVFIFSYTQCGFTNSLYNQMFSNPQR